ncbi:type II toxin-antitoxin system RelE/ParE family toxin [Methylobacterium sp. J-030]|uniref:type II toxin-antitoxin system RelE/ParE family toxin n=1 Tax=Methylobacterium sp. J-030 TaxID=2836627 RepID=UPI001FBA938E|nr:type II toxin-antitoxin system RelE/ParE family toxin [Methylobacterium sp. J-030]MCJ2068679.1 type II toxin-antitoxin system RelE/ParE family toxin [Methylobacterium sp. J-030]
MIGYVLTAAAEADLRDIIRFTRDHWGDAQARRYTASLERGIAHLAAGRGAWREMSALAPTLRMGRYVHHYVFCLPRENAPALIVAIFHERMDVMARLADRLKEPDST